MCLCVASLPLNTLPTYITSKHGPSASQHMASLHGLCVCASLHGLFAWPHGMALEPSSQQQTGRHLHPVSGRPPSGASAIMQMPHAASH
eukprot:121182-Chlamydomonas_euryale.AAC.1